VAVLLGLVFVLGVVDGVVDLLTGVVEVFEGALPLFLFCCGLRLIDRAARQVALDIDAVPEAPAVLFVEAVPDLLDLGLVGLDQLHLRFPGAPRPAVGCSDLLSATEQ